MQKHAATKQVDDKTAEPQEKTKDKTSSKVYEIDSFTIKDARVSFTSIDAKQSEEFTVSKIKFSELKGTPEQIFEQVIIQLSTQVIIEVSKNIAMQQIKGSIKGPAGDAINKVLNNIL